MVTGLDGAIQRLVVNGDAWTNIASRWAFMTMIMMMTMMTMVTMMIKMIMMKMKTINDVDA